MLMLWIRHDVGDEAAEALGRRVTGVGAGAGDHRAGDHQQRRRRPAATRDRVRSVRPTPDPAAAGFLAGPPQQDHGVRHQDLRQHEVAGDRRGVQVDQHGDAAQHDLAEHAGHQSPATSHTRSRR